MATSSELDDRIDKCQRLLDADPNSQIFAALAEAYRKKGELDLAFRICRNGLKVHDKYGSAHVVMAKINLDRGLYDWAEIEANRAAEIDGRTRTIELLLAEIHIYKGEFQPAVKNLRALQSQDPENPQIQKLLEIAQKIPEEQQAALRESGSAENLMDIEQETDEPAEEPVSKVVSAQDIISEAASIKGVRGAILVSRDGLVTESKWKLAVDVHDCGAVMAEVWKALASELVNKSFGEVESILIETDESTFYMVADADGVFVFVTGLAANLGTVRLKIEGLMENYLEAVGGV